MPIADFAGRALGADGCDPASPVINGEVRGTSTNASLYGLIMVQHLPIRAGDEVKIVWRMTGAGALRATLSAPDGTDAALAWGPDRHEGSNYTRPGDEWGIGYVFGRAGCWHLALARDDTAGEVWLRVEP